MRAEPGVTARTVDVHSHPIPDFLREALARAGRSPSLSGFPPWTSDLALATMERFSIARTILSVSTPGVHFGNDSAAGDLARRFNDYLARVRMDWPGRFGGFAALPLPDIDAACREACRALDELGLEGVGALASYGERFLGDPAFDPLMAELDSRDAIVFVHPAGHPSSRGLDLTYPLWMLEYPIDTTRAAVNLLMNETTLRFPRIRFILAHNGGTLPFLAWRICAAPIIDVRYANLDPAVLRTEIGRFYYEVAQSPGAEAFDALQAVADPARILFGTDWPYCSHAVVGRMEQTFDSLDLLSPGARRAVRHENAHRLFGGQRLGADESLGVGPRAG